MEASDELPTLSDMCVEYLSSVRAAPGSYTTVLQSWGLLHGPAVICRTRTTGQGCKAQTLWKPQNSNSRW